MTTSRIVFLNGEFLPVDKAYISVMDRGFLFGDGVYEIIPVFNHQLFLAKEHLQRLRNSLAAINLPFGQEDGQIISLCQQLMLRNPEQGADRAIYIQITRGAAENREHCFPVKVPPTFFMQCSETSPSTAAELEKGARAITVPDIRWQWCHIKAISLLPNVLLAQQAKAAHAKEAILIRDGMAIEGAISNLFIVKEGVIITPPTTHEILPGVTRNLLLQLAEKNHLPFREESIPEASLFAADEVWMTGSIKEVLPIVRINNSVIGNGKVGPISLRMLQLYQGYKNTSAS